MKLRVAALVLPLILGSSALFAAASATQNNVSFQQALDIIEKAGYTNLHKIELEHNYYEVDALDAQGKRIEFNIDATTGAITPAKHMKHKKHHKHAKHAKHSKVKQASGTDSSDSSKSTDSTKSTNQ